MISVVFILVTCASNSSTEFEDPREPSSKTVDDYGKFESVDGLGCAEMCPDPRYGSVVHCAYPGQGNCEFTFAEQVPVRPYDTLEYSIDVKLLDFAPTGAFFVCGQLIDAEGRVFAPMFAPRQPDFRAKTWQRVRARLAVPRNAAGVRLAIWSNRRVDALLANPSIEKTGALTPALSASTRQAVRLRNDKIAVVIHPQTWSFVATDLRCGRAWRSFEHSSHIAVFDVECNPPSRAVFHAVYLPAHAPMQLTIELPQDRPEFSIAASMKPSVPMASWAAIFGTVPPLYEPSDACELVVPLGEGFLYKTTETEAPVVLMQVADGAGLTMPWFGIADMETGAAIMCFTRDENDALARLAPYAVGTQRARTVLLQWMPQKNQWGYDRTAAFWLADRGGYVALCKRYRDEAAAKGRLLTLAEKQRALPQIARLCGAPNCWFHFLWHMKDRQKRMDVLRWFHDRDVDRMLFSTSEALVDTDELVAWGYLTSQYDLYTDVWPEEIADKANVPERVFGYPDDIQILPNGEMKRGWVQKTKHGDFPGYTLCPARQLAWAKKRIPPTLEGRNMLARFIDTTTALPLGECYDPDHPMTRADDKAARLRLLEYVRDLGLIVGSEMGVDWAVPVLAYCEGMLSPVPYRHPDAGYLHPNMKPVPETFQYILNPAVRVPLWELVYHDCVVAYWYWGDCTNTFPELWDLRNLFNALYATPPLYEILDDEQVYLDQRERIVKTHMFLKPVFDAVQFSEMVDHRFLTSDRKLQLSEFANGARVAANFSEHERTCEGVAIPPKGYVILGPRGRTAAQTGGVPHQASGAHQQSAQEQRIELAPVSRTIRARSPDLHEGADLSRLSCRACASWMTDFVELRFPEVLKSSIGFHYLDHYRTTIPPLSELAPLPEWQHDEETRRVSYDCITREGLAFGAAAAPTDDEILLEFYVRNETGRTLDFVEFNPCLNLAESPEFSARNDLTRLFAVFDGQFQGLSNTTPTPEQMGRGPWIILLTQTGVRTFQGPKVTSTWWRVDQVADENLMAASSADGKHLIGYTWNGKGQVLMTNAGYPCLHAGPGPSPRLEPGVSYEWRGKIYLMPYDPDALLARYKADQKRWEHLPVRVPKTPPATRPLEPSSSASPRFPAGCSLPASDAARRPIPIEGIRRMCTAGHFAYSTSDNTPPKCLTRPLFPQRVYSRHSPWTMRRTDSPEPSRGRRSTP